MECLFAFGNKNLFVQRIVTNCFVKQFVGAAAAMLLNEVVNDAALLYLCGDFLINDVVYVLPFEFTGGNPVFVVGNLLFHQQNCLASLGQDFKILVVCLSDIFAIPVEFKSGTIHPESLNVKSEFKGGEVLVYRENFVLMFHAVSI